MLSKLSLSACMVESSSRATYQLITESFSVSRWQIQRWGMESYRFQASTLVHIFTPASNMSEFVTVGARERNHWSNFYCKQKYVLNIKRRQSSFWEFHMCFFIWVPWQSYELGGFTSFIDEEGNRLGNDYWWAELVLVFLQRSYRTGTPNQNSMPPQVRFCSSIHFN